MSNFRRPGPKSSKRLIIVEEVRGFRMRRSIPEYLIKWVGFPESDNTWEPLGNLYEVRELLEKFNDKRAEIQSTLSSPSGEIMKEELLVDQENLSKNSKKKMIHLSEVKPNENKVNMAEKKPERIIGANLTEERIIHYLVKFENQEEPELLLGTDVKYKWPDIVIKYFEDRIIWNKRIQVEIKR